jgi:steroid 5-alpha reductase family enzyme
MTFTGVYFSALPVVIFIMTLLWVRSIFIKNVSIVDLFWGFGFVILSLFYFQFSSGYLPRKIITLLLVMIWGIRLSVYLTRRNMGMGEDFRYREFRKKYGEERYWWVSFFQTFLLQGILMWLISVTLLGAMTGSDVKELSVADYAGILLWITGMIFEAGGDWQLAKFKSNPLNKGKVLNKGLWRYTRHPNYFGDSAVWWGYGLLSIGAGNYLAAFGSVMMTALIIRVSGVALLEKSLVDKKPEYRDYIRNTSSFIPWPPRKK